MTRKKIAILVVLGCAGALWTLHHRREPKTNARASSEASSVGISGAQPARAEALQDPPPSVSYPAPLPPAPGQITATENASAFRESMCACETRSCIDSANQRFVKEMGKVAGS